ncbi:hypothetical protein GGF32_001847 [Allomyces javanicus]|nr:hypothetical protein GGF32_001847 [Allomyces javanicus]
MDPRVLAADWDQVTLDDFLALERAIHTRAAIVRELKLRATWVLAVDAEYCHDGDAQTLPGGMDDDPTARFAKGVRIPITPGFSWAQTWTRAHDQYFTLALRTIPGQRYQPDLETLALSSPISNLAALSFSYQLCVYGHVREIKDAMARGTVVPHLGTFLRQSMLRIRAMMIAQRPSLHILDSVETPLMDLNNPVELQEPLTIAQARTLAWLLTLERDVNSRTISVRKLLPNASKFDQQEFCAFGIDGVSPAVQIGPDVECRGALDLTAGDGKIRSTLALVHANPFRSLWHEEARRVLPASATIILLTSFAEYERATWNDLLLADLVLLSTNLLTCPHPTRNVKSWLALTDMFYLIQRGRASFGSDAGAIFEGTFFHRIVMDRMSSVSPQSSSDLAVAGHHVAAVLGGLRASFWLGLDESEALMSPPAPALLPALDLLFSASLQAASLQALWARARMVNVRDVPHSHEAAQVWLNACVRTSNSASSTRFCTLGVRLTAVEMALIAAHGDRNLRNRIPACNHHHAVMVDGNDAGGGLTVDEAAALCQADCERKMAHLAGIAAMFQTTIAQSLAYANALIGMYPAVAVDLPAMDVAISRPDHTIRVDGRAVLAALADPVHVPIGNGKPDPVPTGPVSLPSLTTAHVRTDSPLAEALKWARRLGSAFRSFVSAVRELRAVACDWSFLDTAMNLTRRAEPLPCAQCEQAMIETCFLTRCTHGYCSDCAPLVADRGSCATCRARLDGPRAMTKLRLMPLLKPDPDGDAALVDAAKYGTKLAAVVAYIASLVRHNQSARMIIFTQYPRLTAILTRALADARVPAIDLDRPDEYRGEEQARVALLAPDSMEGPLKQITHVVLVHPLVGPCEAVAHAAELNAIRHVVCADQAHELMVVRFVACNTVEEELAAQRTGVPLRPVAAMLDSKEFDGARVHSAGGGLAE